MRTFKALVKAKFIRNQALRNLCEAIAEHRWNDAQTLLPVAIAISHENTVSPYFLWKAIYIVMLNSNVPECIQFKIMHTFFKTPVRRHEVAIGWLTHMFTSIDEQNVEQLNQIITMHARTSHSVDPLSLLFHGYYALFFYFKWKLLISSKELSAKDLTDVNNAYDCTPNCRSAANQLKHLALKAHRLLSKAFSLLNHSSKDKKEDEAEDFEMACEWILGPLLEMEEYQKLNSRSKDDKGTSLIRDYVAHRRTQLPALIMYYRYVIIYYPEETTLTGDLLKEIVCLSPENSLVLNYVDFLLLSCNHHIDHEANSTDVNSGEKSSCLLAGKNIKVLLTCVKLLCAFVEYEMCRKDLKAWTTLTSILRFFQRSWISCWNCSECKKSRRKIKKMTEILVLWPSIFWSSRAISCLISHPKVMVHSAFASFFFGYKKISVKQSLEILEKHDCQKERELLLALLGLRGQYSKDFRIYLAERKDCFDAIELSSTSKSPNAPSTLELNCDHFAILPEMTFQVSIHPCVEFRDTKNPSNVPYFGKLYGSQTNIGDSHASSSSHVCENEVESPNYVIVSKRKRSTHVSIATKKKKR